MPPEDKEQDGNEKKNNFSAGNLFHKGKQKSKTSERADNNSNKNKKQSIQWWRDLTRAEKIQIIGLLLNFFTLIAFICISTVQIAKTNEALQRADTSNYFLSKSIDNAWSSTKVEMRPYVGVVGATLEGIRTNSKLHIVLNIENFGNTPAYDVKIYSGLKKGGTGVYNVDWKDTTELKKNDASYMIGAKTIFRMPYFPENYISKNDSTGIIKGNIFLAVLGYIYYSDIFGDNHSIKYCLSYSRLDKKFTLYAKFNDTDRYQ